MLRLGQGGGGRQKKNEEERRGLTCGGLAGH
nr:MAG TPA: hypothetical protein [Caudoviricetes sp.]